MFKKIEIWVLYLTILVSMLFAIAFGVLVRQEIEGTTKTGNIDISFLSKPAAEVARIPEKLLRLLLRANENAINNFWTKGRYFFEQDGFDGTPNTEKSYMLLSRYDGDLEEGVIELVDLTNFNVLHTWNPDIDAFNDSIEQVDEFKDIDRDHNNHRQTLQYPKLTDDGGLLFNSSPLRKINACSKIIFQNTTDFFHHSIETDIDGNIWVPSNLYPQSLPARKVGRDVEAFLDDAIVKLSPSGEIKFKKSVSQILIDNGLEYLLFSVGDPKFTSDPNHLNDIQPVNADGEFWKKGDVFLSLRNQSMILLYRPSTNKIVWKGTGPFFYQHDVDLLDDHRISFFNNNSKMFFADANVIDGHNEVIVYDFKTDKYSSYMKDSLSHSDVRTRTGGLHQILPNGDLFIEESNYGRTLYFNADGSLRWTHVNRADNGNVYFVGASRILFTKDDIKTVDNFLESKGTCND